MLSRFILPYLPPRKEEVNTFARVRLSVCLLARLLKNACMDLDEMLRVDRCQNMDELINFWALFRIIVRMPEPDCVLRYRMRCNAEFYYVGEIPRTGIGSPVAAATSGFKMNLFIASRGNNFVGDTCAPSSALLVLSYNSSYLKTIATSTTRIRC